MKSQLKPDLDNLDKALGSLESFVKKRVAHSKKHKEEPQLDLTSRDEKAVNRKVALKLDQTISHLETLLSGGE